MPPPTPGPAVAPASPPPHSTPSCAPPWRQTSGRSATCRCGRAERPSPAERGWGSGGCERREVGKGEGTGVTKQATMARGHSGKQRVCGSHTTPRHRSPPKHGRAWPRLSPHLDPVQVPGRTRSHAVLHLDYQLCGRGDGGRGREEGGGGRERRKSVRWGGRRPLSPCAACPKPWPRATITFPPPSHHLPAPSRTPPQDSPPSLVGTRTRAPAARRGRRCPPHCAQSRSSRC